MARVVPRRPCQKKVVQQWPDVRLVPCLSRLISRPRAADTLRAVRRTLVIFFIVFLPFQFAWGAAASYCTHEKNEKVSHFGHHAHVHKVSAQNDEAAVSFADGCDPDCGYCHSGYAQPLPSTTLSLAIATASVYSPPEALRTRFRAPNLIERPNWSLA